MDTIFAPATARGRAGVAVVRISGSGAFDAVRALSGLLPEPRSARLSPLRGANGLIDTGLVLCFPGPGSFTGEDVAELQVHGSPAVVQALLHELGSREGFRLAEPGEFTRRALLNGRLDLTEVEALADLIDAETEAQRRQAVAQMSGRLRDLAERLREQLIRAAALVEAGIDFSDEELPEDLIAKASALLRAVLGDLQRELAGAGISERLRDGFEVAIVGRPNSGKSSLLNVLSGREAAITSTVAGTTRDVIEVRMDLRGLPVTMLDTAGLRETGDEIEKIGVARGLERARGADLRVFLLDREGEIPFLTPGPDDIVVLGKADLLECPADTAVSSVTGQGVQRLIDTVQQRLQDRLAGAGALNRARHVQSVSRAAAAIEAALTELESGAEQPELAAEALRQALHALSTLVGRVDVEALLGEIFASFCIGK